MPANRVTSNSPLHIILILDDSASMEGQPIADVNQAVSNMISELKLISNGIKPYFKVSVIKFGGHPTVLAAALSEQSIDVQKVASLDGSSGGTDANAALLEACALLQQHPGKSTDFVPFVFFLSDGAPDDIASALDAGRALKTLNIPCGSPRLVTIGFGDCQDAFMSELASNRELYKRLKASRDVVALLPAIGTLAGGAGGADALLGQISEINL